MKHRNGQVRKRANAMNRRRDSTPRNARQRKSSNSNNNKNEEKPYHITVKFHLYSTFQMRPLIISYYVGSALNAICSLFFARARILPPYKRKIK